MTWRSETVWTDRKRYWRKLIVMSAMCAIFTFPFNTQPILYFVGVFYIYCRISNLAVPSVPELDTIPLLLQEFSP